MIRVRGTGTTEKLWSLNQIAGPIEPHMDAFDRAFDEAIRSKVPLVDIVAKYVIRRKGKKVRPILVLLSAALCGGVNERTCRGAALVEVLHTATLIHDDVIDEADTRRGFPSINAVWKNKISILMGDYLLARGLLLCLDRDDFDFLKVTSTAVKRMSEGEIFQIQKSRQMDTDEPTYMRIIGDKTASLLATCCEIGAVSATSEKSAQEALRAYGEEVGLAFQIRDDLLDYTGRRSITGKPTGLDLSEKKLTLPIIHALAQAPEGERKKILSIIRNGGKRIGTKDVASVIRFAEEQGGIAYAAGKAADFSASARNRIASFPDSPAKTSLFRFADFVVQRDR